MMVKLLSMNQLEIVSKDSIIQRMKKLKSLPVLHSMPQVKLPSSATLTDFTFITSMLKDLNGMKSAANKLKTTIQ